MIENTPVSFNLREFRKILHLPCPNDFQRNDQFLTDYKEFTSETELLQDVRRLGYNGEIRRVSDFERNNLAPVWFTFFFIINRSLTLKGQDKCSLAVL